MKFSDNIIRGAHEDVYVLRMEKDFEQTEEYNSLSWEVESFDFDERGQHLYSIPAYGVKIGESIYDKRGGYICYRSE